MKSDQEIIEAIKLKMNEGWSFVYSCGLVGVRYNTALEIFKSDKELSKLLGGSIKQRQINKRLDKESPKISNRRQMWWNQK